MSIFVYCAFGLTGKPLLVEVPATVAVLALHELSKEFAPPCRLEASCRMSLKRVCRRGNMHCTEPLDASVLRPLRKAAYVKSQIS